LAFAAAKGHPEIPLREAGIRCVQADFMPVKGLNNLTLGEFALFKGQGSGESFCNFIRCPFFREGYTEINERFHYFESNVPLIESINR
jgi:hypothetical protein